MTTKTNLIIALLKLTSSGSATKDFVVKEANVPVEVVNKILSDLRENMLIEYENKLIEISSNQRIALAIHAINNGTDIERVCKVLEWKEFENFTATAFENNNFVVKRNFRFKAVQRRWEIDVLAYSKPIIVCVDCKLWRRGWGNSAIMRIAAAQSQRTQALAKNLQRLQRDIGLDCWEQATLFPMILSLFPGQVKFYGKIPVVPILQLQNFLDEFRGHKRDLIHFCTMLGLKVSDYVNGTK